MAGLHTVTGSMYIMCYVIKCKKWEFIFCLKNVAYEQQRLKACYHECDPFITPNTSHRETRASSFTLNFSALIHKSSVGNWHSFIHCSPQV